MIRLQVPETYYSHISEMRIMIRSVLGSEFANANECSRERREAAREKCQENDLCQHKRVNVKRVIGDKFSASR